MSKVINMDLSTSGINKAIKELKQYQKWVQQKTDQLTERLAMIGIKEASVRFNGAYVDSAIGNDTALSVERISNGYKIVAEGTQTWFIEFGTGVYYNGSEPYPTPPGRPANVGAIGTYGKGKGKQDAWYYKDEEGVHRTHGMPAAMPMYHASVEMERNIRNIAREVFK